jgi:hypothetical protein
MDLSRLVSVHAMAVVQPRFIKFDDTVERTVVELFEVCYRVHALLPTLSVSTQGLPLPLLAHQLS